MRDDYSELIKDAGCLRFEHVAVLPTDATPRSAAISANDHRLRPGAVIESGDLPIRCRVGRAEPSVVRSEAACFAARKPDFEARQQAGWIGGGSGGLEGANKLAQGGFGDRLYLVYLFMSEFSALKAGKRGSAAAVGLLMLCAVNTPGGDWPQYRGPTTDGISTELISTNWRPAIFPAAKAPTAS